MDDIARQLEDIRIQEQELQERAAQLKRQRLVLQKQQYGEEIKRIDAELEEPVSEINRLSTILTEQQHHIEDFEKNPRSVKGRVPKIQKQPPNQRAKAVRRTRVMNPPILVNTEPVVQLKQEVPKPTEVVIDFSSPVTNEIHDEFYSELVNDHWSNDDDGQHRITQLMYGELSPADTEKINGSDKLYEDYINGNYTPSSYVPPKPSQQGGYHAAIADHLRRRAKGTRWRPQDVEQFRPFQQERVLQKPPPVESDEEVESINQLEHLVSKASRNDHIFRHTRVE